MPIRFRCSFCNQLMGISRRKSGTVVRCPVCASPVTVPAEAGEDEGKGLEEKSPPRKLEAPPLFERSDFDEIFAAPLRPGRPDRSGGPSRAAAPSVAQGRAEIPPREGPIEPGAGIWLTPRLATFLSLAVVVALAVVFGLGIWVGVSLRP
jgi:hypothetical protein